MDTEYESCKDRDGSYKQRFSGYRFRHMLKVEFPSDNDRLGKVLYALANCKVRLEFRISYTVAVLRRISRSHGDSPLSLWQERQKQKLCDVIRSRSTIEAQVLQDALKQYARRENKNLHQLMEHANLFHVDHILIQYMEVLL